MREPNGEWTTRCVSPVSSKKRSKMTRSCVGSAPSAAFAAPRYSTSCFAALSPTPSSLAEPAHGACGACAVDAARAIVSLQRADRRRQLVAAPRRLAEPERNRRRLAVRVRDVHLAGLDLLRCDTTRCRAGTRRPACSRTRSPRSACRRAARSAAARRRSRTDPGIAPPFVIAVSAAPRRPRSTLLTRSKCRCALRRPRCVVKPSASMRATATKLVARRARGSWPRA